MNILHKKYNFSTTKKDRMLIMFYERIQKRIKSRRKRKLIYSKIKPNKDIN